MALYEQLVRPDAPPSDAIQHAPHLIGSTRRQPKRLNQLVQGRPASFGLPSRVAALEEWAKGQGLMP